MPLCAACPLDHGVAVVQHLGQRHRLGHKGQATRFDQRQVQDFVDQAKQVPAGFKNLVHALLLRPSRRRRARLQQLRKAQHRIQR